MKFFSQPEWDADVPEESTHENLTQKSKLKKRNKEQAASASSNAVVNSDISDLNKPHKEKKERRQVKETEVSSANDIEKSRIKRKNDEHEINTTKKHKPNEETIKSVSVASSAVSTKVSDSRSKKKKKSNKKENKVSKPKHKPMLKFSNIQQETDEALNGDNDNGSNISTDNHKINEPNSETHTDVSEKPAIVKKKKLAVSKNAMKKLKKAQNTPNVIEKLVAPVRKNVKSNANTPISAKTLKNRKRRSKKNKTPNTIKTDAVEKLEIPKKEEIVSENIKNVATNVKKLNFFATKIRNMLNTEMVKRDTTNETDNIPVVKLSTKNDKKTRLLKPLRQRMVERLKGARFRYLNEQMYVKESNDAQQLFKEDPQAFQAYHDGYRQQVNKWPLNPLDVIIKDVSQMPKEYVIADLGCGDGRLGKSVPNKVHSFDLVSLDPSVKACDMSHTPLLTAEVNVVVFCLSLMGTNLKEYILEANRVLKVGGLLKVAEVESRFESVETFLKDVEKYGFTLLKSDLNHNLFYFMDFKKEKDIKKRNKLPQLSLKPCYYKKR